MAPNSAHQKSDSSSRRNPQATYGGSEPVGSILRWKGHDVWSVDPDASVYQAMSLMAEKSVGALVVCAGDALVGIISERDYARKLVLQGRSSRETAVREIMTSPVISVRPEHTLDDCMRLMTYRRIRHLPVVQGEKVVGVLSIGDLVRRIVEAQGEIIQQLQGYIAGKYPG